MGDKEPSDLERLKELLAETERHGPKRLLAVHSNDVLLRELAVRVLEDHERRLKAIEGEL